MDEIFGEEILFCDGDQYDFSCYTIPRNNILTEYKIFRLERDIEKFKLKNTKLVNYDKENSNRKLWKRVDNTSWIIISKTIDQYEQIYLLGKDESIDNSSLRNRLTSEELSRFRRNYHGWKIDKSVQEIKTCRIYLRHLEYFEKNIVNLCHEIRSKVPSINPINISFGSKNIKSENLDSHEEIVYPKISTFEINSLHEGRINTYYWIEML